MRTFAFPLVVVEQAQYLREGCKRPYLLREMQASLVRSYADELSPRRVGDISKLLEGPVSGDAVPFHLGPQVRVIGCHDVYI